MVCCNSDDRKQSQDVLNRIQTNADILACTLEMWVKMQTRILIHGVTIQMLVNARVQYTEYRLFNTLIVEVRAALWCQERV